MIARHEIQKEQAEVWAQLAAPLPSGVISWRQDGRPISQDGKFFARFVAYIEANTVRERLDSVMPGEWNLALELLPPVSSSDDDAAPYAFKARLQILGVVREDVGTGKDYKQASTDAFKRAAVRFGIGHELYSFEQNWVQVDGDGKYAKPVEDPQAAYNRRGSRSADVSVEATAAAAPALSLSSHVPMTNDVPPCPKCSGRMWDNRIGKRNPKAPDFKCRDRSCDGVIWPPKPGSAPSQSDPSADEPHMPENASLVLGDDEIPF